MDETLDPISEAEQGAEPKRIRDRVNRPVDTLQLELAYRRSLTAPVNLRQRWFRLSPELRLALALVLLVLWIGLLFVVSVAAVAFTAGR